MEAFDWLENDEPLSTQHSASANTQQPTGGYQRVMVIKLPLQPNEAISDPFSALSGLPLLAGDKTFLSGALGAWCLPDGVAYGLLLEYRKRWERAAKRCTNPNGADNAGRKAANLWVLGGCHGVISYQDVGKLDKTVDG